MWSAALATPLQIRHMHDTHQVDLNPGNTTLNAMQVGLHCCDECKMLPLPRHQVQLTNCGSSSHNYMQVGPESGTVQDRPYHGSQGVASKAQQSTQRGLTRWKQVHIELHHVIDPSAPANTTAAQRECPHCDRDISLQTISQSYCIRQSYTYASFNCSL
jgi:hypothetical protein